MKLMNTNSDFFARKHKELGVDLNDVQQQAVLHGEGPLLLLASPGSGKTTTIIMRIGYLIEEHGINPSRIKAVTFSRASANDMRERFKRFFPDFPADSVDFSTIHSLAFGVVREHFRKTRVDFHLIEGEGGQGEQDGEQEHEYREDRVQPQSTLAQWILSQRLPLHKKIILRELYKNIVGEPITDDQLDELTTYISFIKNKLLLPIQLEKVKCDVPQAQRIYQKYEEFKLSGTNKLLVDYDDMLVIANQALADDRQLLHKVQQRYDYVLTDESQDTSMVQHSMIEKLVEKHSNLCVVADDDQSIYTWRAAEPEYLLNFKQVYPNAVILKMEQNYRSSSNIVDIANQFIKRNKQRYDKNMFTHNPPQQPIVIHNMGDYTEQAKYLAKQISAQNNLREVAVLYRNNSSSISLMNEFDRAGIPFYMKDGDNRFFSHWVVEDVLNFMRMAFTDKRPELLDKIHTKFNGYITKQQMLALSQVRNQESVFDNLITYVPLQDYQVSKLTESKETFQRMKTMTPKQAIVTIRYKLGYEKALEKMCERFGFRKEHLLGILNTLEDIADGLETLELFAGRLTHLKSVMKTSKSNKYGNAVTFSTFHSAKGLEFEYVYMIDLIEGVIPSQEDLSKAEKGDDAAMEEAVRLFYVGMTRAKSHLELLSYTKRDSAAVKESSFVTNVRNIQNPPKIEPDKRVKVVIVDSVRAGKSKSRGSKLSSKPNPNAIRQAADLNSGGAVRHALFGLGTIIQCTPELVEIHFETEEKPKKLSLKLCLDSGLLEPAGMIE